MEALKQNGGKFEPKRWLHKLYPNPNDGNMILEYEIGPTEKGILSIYDLSGKEIESFSMPENCASLKLNFNSISDGLYFFTCRVNGDIKKQGS